MDKAKQKRSFVWEVLSPWVVPVPFIIAGSGGDAKYWLEPSIELAMSNGIAQHELNNVHKIIEKHKDELTNAWRSHLGS